MQCRYRPLHTLTPRGNYVPGPAPPPKLRGGGPLPYPMGWGVWKVHRCQEINHKSQLILTDINIKQGPGYKTQGG